MNEPVFETEAVVDAEGHIEADGLPFKEGQKVRLIVWAAPESDPHAASVVAERLKAYDEHLAWTKEHLRNLPVLSDEGMSRESIYEGREL